MMRKFSSRASARYVPDSQFRRASGKAGSGSSSKKSGGSTVASVGMGIFVAGVGVMITNANERQCVKQEFVNDYLEKHVVSVNDGDAAETLFTRGERALRYQFVHISGTLQGAGGSMPTDADLGVEFPDALRVIRVVEMYQTEETSTTDEKTKETTYSYSDKWTEDPFVTSDDINPKFPSFRPVKQGNSMEIVCSDDDRFKLKVSDRFGERLGKLKGGGGPSQIKVSDATQAGKQGLQLSADGKYFYSRGKSQSNPQVGDIRVSYRAVSAGNYTILGKYSPDPDTKVLDLHPFSAKLIDTFGGKVQVVETTSKAKLPSESDPIGRLQYRLDNWSAGVTPPLEFSYVCEGELGKVPTLVKQRQSSESGDLFFSLLGVGLCAGGGILGAAPVAASMGPAVQAGVGAVTGLGMAWNVRRNAREYVTDQLNNVGSAENL